MENDSIPRSIVWRLSLNDKSLSRYEKGKWHGILTNERQIYLQNKRRLLRAPDGKYPLGLGFDDDEKVSNSSSITEKQYTNPLQTPLDVNNPLSLADDSPWPSHFAKLSTLEQIQKDIHRAIPEDEEHSQNEKDRFVTQLSSILSVWSLLEENVSIGYRQGMHELAVACWLVVKKDVEDLWQISPKSDLLQAKDVEADSFSLFQSIMYSASRWYIWKSTGPGKLPIQQHCEMVEKSLSSNDVELSRHLARLGVSIQIFAIRWIRLLFLREFGRETVFELWENLFELDASLHLVDHVCVALLIRLRNELLTSENQTALQLLLNVPRDILEPGQSVRILLDDARQIHRRHTAVISGRESAYVHTVPQTWHNENSNYRQESGFVGSEWTKGISAQSLGNGLFRAINNVQRSVNAAYQAHTARNTSNDGFPPSMSVTGARDELFSRYQRNDETQEGDRRWTS